MLNKRTCTVEESVHVVFDESDNGILSEGFKELNLNKHFNDVSDDELDANDHNEDKKKNMQDPIQSLDKIEEKQVERIEDSQPDLETQPQDLETTPENDFSKKLHTIHTKKKA